MARGGERRGEGGEEESRAEERRGERGEIGGGRGEREERTMCSGARGTLVDGVSVINVVLSN